MSDSYKPVRSSLARKIAVGSIAVVTMTLAPGGLAAAAAPAAAGSLVYVKGGTVYVAQLDGTQAHAVTTGDNGWTWPSGRTSTRRRS